MVVLKKKNIEIQEKFDVPKARKRAKNFAEEIDFKEKEIEEIAIVVSELANNLISHTDIGGTLILKEIKRGKTRGIEIVSIDRGPGIYNSEGVLEDGYSTKDSLGIGLGAVRRLMNDFIIQNKNKKKSNPIKTKIITRKYKSINIETEQILNIDLKFGVFSRSKVGERYNGDGYFIKHFDDKILFSVIDGLGHGKKAYEVSEKVKNCLKIHYRKDLDSLISVIHKNLKRTRGAAACFALFDKIKLNLKYISIGNIQMRIYNGNEYKTLLNFNGTLGVALRSYSVNKIGWKKGNLIIANSDGIASQYKLPHNYLFAEQHPMKIAKLVFDKYGKEHDDATVLVGGG
ncbi:MAG: ATP-binding SpoIIE family protein phosphatase [Promethearchaeia archaeon]